MENQNTTSEITEKKVRKTNTMPVKETDLLTLAENVANKWANTPDITLRWINVKEYNESVKQFREALDQRTQIGSGRQSTTKMLKNLDDSLNEAIENVKIAILNKFGRKDGKSYFSEFGILKINKAYRFPQDRNQRLQSLDTLLRGLVKYTIEVTNYPFNFFKNVKDQYIMFVQEAQNIDSTVATEVSNKNEAIKQVEKVLDALIQVLKANYPDTYKSELRAWGFQKEKY